jgi:hypothetical protein
MRVFRDVRGHMAGTDFDLELLRCMMQSAVVVPVITLGAMARLCTLDASRVDMTFAEYAFALYLYDTRALAGFCPLVVGEEAVEPHSGTTVLDNLFRNEQFKTLRAALPDTPPAATWAFVRRTLAAAGETLPAGWDAMSVREVMCASSRMQGEASLTSGVFIKDCFFLEGAKDHLRLLLMREFAEKVRRRIGIAAAALNAAAGAAALAARPTAAPMRLWPAGLGFASPSATSASDATSSAGGSSRADSASSMLGALARRLRAPRGRSRAAEAAVTPPPSVSDAGGIAEAEDDVPMEDG